VIRVRWVPGDRLLDPIVGRRTKWKSPRRSLPGDSRWRASPPACSFGVR